MPLLLPFFASSEHFSSTLVLIDLTKAAAWAIASLSSKSQTVSITCTGAGLSSPPLSLKLPVGHTLFTQGCAQAASEDPADEFLSPDIKSERDTSTTGIEITSTAGLTEFGAFGLAPEKLGKGSVLSLVSFADPATSKSTTIFAGVPIGSTPLLPNSAYTPRLSLANFGFVTHRKLSTYLSAVAVGRCGRSRTR